MNNRTLGKYEIVERLGRGGMAEVYRAYHANLDRYVAIKVLHSFLADDAEFKTRFEKEARNIARLKHAHIVQVYDFDFEPEDESYYMVMELIDGVTLKDRMLELERNGEHIPLTEALRITREAASALAYAHKAGMIHRDVKPANLLLDKHEQDRVVLTDFGIAKMVTGAQFTMTGGLVGTPAYMSPEQGVGETGDERSDLYSLGVILFQMLAGYPPYEAETPLALILKHMNDPIPSVCADNPRLPDEIDDIITRAMAKEPANRYQNASDLIAAVSALEGTLVTRPVRVRIPPPTDSPSDDILPATPTTKIERPPQPEPAIPIIDTKPNLPEEDTIKLSDAGHRTSQQAVTKPQIPIEAPKTRGRSPLLMLVGAIIILGGIIGGYVAAASNGMLPAIGFLASETPTETAAATASPLPTATATSMPTATETIVPTATPSPTASLTSTATMTFTPTVTASPSATATTTATHTPTSTATASPIPAVNITQTAQILSTATFEACTFDYAIIEHNPADGADGGFFAVNTSYERTIRFLNTGTCAWERNTSLAFVNGSGENFAAGPRIFIQERVEVGEETEVQFEGTLPERGAVGADGNVIPIGGQWQLRTPGQIAIGEPFTISVLVYDPG